MLKFFWKCFLYGSLLFIYDELCKAKIVKTPKDKLFNVSKGIYFFLLKIYTIIFQNKAQILIADSLEDGKRENKILYKKLIK